MCNKAVDTYLFEFDSILDRYKTQDMCDTPVSNNP